MDNINQWGLDESRRESVFVRGDRLEALFISRYIDIVKAAYA